jgi:hypothetical protein
VRLEVTGSYQKLGKPIGWEGEAKRPSSSWNASPALIEHGILKEDRLKKELLTKAELETAAHRQGFASLDEVEPAVIEPCGTL